jgi:hypothetical protein
MVRLESSLSRNCSMSVPGANSFWLVLLLILASGGVTLALLFWRRLL